MKKPPSSATPDPAGPRNGAELVALVERFRLAVFVGLLVIFALAAIAAVVMLPTRNSVSEVGLTTPTVVLTLVLVAATPAALWRAPALYWLLRRRLAFALVPVVLAAGLLSYPLRSELWWPACVLLMLTATVVHTR